MFRCLYDVEIARFHDGAFQFEKALVGFIEIEHLRFRDQGVESLIDELLFIAIP